MSRFATAASIEERAAYWCVRLADGSLDDAEHCEFDAWLAIDPTHGEALDRVRRVDALVDVVASERGLLTPRVDALQHMRREQARRDAGWWRMDVRFIASGMAAMLLIAAALLYMITPPRQVEYRTGVGERRVIVLADGSRLSLDASTRVEVALGRERRALTLREGRAKVDVAHDPLRPLSFAIADRTVVATGTSFGVEILRRKMQVLLYSGRVEVLDTARDDRGTLSSAAAVSLRPGQRYIAAIGGSRSRVSTIGDQTLAWEGGQVSFSDEPLVDAVERMNRYSRQKIILDQASVAQMHISGLYDAGDSAAFVEGVSAVLPLLVTRRGENYVLTPRHKVSVP